MALCGKKKIKNKKLGERLFRNLNIRNIFGGLYDTADNVPFVHVCK